MGRPRKFRAGERTLTVCDLLQIERMSGEGLGPQTIAANLNLTDDEFFVLQSHDPRVAESIRYGRHRGIARMAAALSKAGAAGDVGAMRFYLERISTEFRPPRGPIVVTVQERPPAMIDMDAVALRFDRQRRLVDGTAEELQVDKAKEKPPGDTAPDGDKFGSHERGKVMP